MTNVLLDAKNSHEWGESTFVDAPRPLSDSSCDRGRHGWLAAPSQAELRQRSACAQEQPARRLANSLVVERGLWPQPDGGRNNNRRVRWCSLAVVLVPSLVPSSAPICRRLMSDAPASCGDDESNGDQQHLSSRLLGVIAQVRSVGNSYPSAIHKMQTSRGINANELGGDRWSSHALTPMLVSTHRCQSVYFWTVAALTFGKLSLRLSPICLVRVYRKRAWASHLHRRGPSRLESTRTVGMVGTVVLMAAAASAAGQR